MQRLALAAVLLSLVTAAVGCALPGWETPKPPYLDLQGNSDEYTESKWIGRGAR